LRRRAIENNRSVSIGRLSCDSFPKIFGPSIESRKIASMNRRPVFLFFFIFFLFMNKQPYPHLRSRKRNGYYDWQQKNELVAID